MFVLPKSTAPALARSLATVQDCVGWKPARILEPEVVVMPAVSHRSFSATGIPCIGPRSLPDINAVSAARASARALSVVTVM
jgi:hypothetical protein